MQRSYGCNLTTWGMQGLNQQSSELMPMAMWCTGMLILPLHLPGKWTIGILTLEEGRL
ncbi:hypothetical protein BDL97_01G127200 [Sphagnum fallax]|nr:hypothetical protein BDL97_01G127200 [Sphagnum fallax]